MTSGWATFQLLFWGRAESCPDRLAYKCALSPQNECSARSEAGLCDERSMGISDRIPKEPSRSRSLPRTKSSGAVTARACWIVG